MMSSDNNCGDWNDSGENQDDLDRKNNVTMSDKNWQFDQYWFRSLAMIKFTRSSLTDPLNTN